MHKRTSGADTAVLVSLDFGVSDYAESLGELRLLAESAGVRSVRPPGNLWCGMRA